MNINGSTALVTGANRGLGAALCRALIERGAAKVFAAARQPELVDMPGVIPLRLDITSTADIAAAVEQCGDVDLLINNAGISTGTSALSGSDAGRQEFDTNVFGPLEVSRAFAPTLAANDGGAIVNVLSVLSWFSAPGSAMYSAAKAASWSLTNSLRQELLAQHTHVLALHVGYMDTDMTAGIDAPKSSPEVVAARTLDGLEADAFEVLADDVSRHVRAQLSSDLTALYPALS
jgi:NAD(P)-dependent dehydrogenase (short-subunit alcohol dehydrogenase family)